MATEEAEVPDAEVESQEMPPEEWVGEELPEPAPTKKHREYRLELFEEGNNRSQARVRGLAREGWEFPTIHGFVRNLTMNRGTDRFFIVVASRDTEVPG